MGVTKLSFPPNLNLGSSGTASQYHLLSTHHITCASTSTPCTSLSYLGPFAYIVTTMAGNLITIQRTLLGSMGQTCSNYTKTTANASSRIDRITYAIVVFLLPCLVQATPTLAARAKLQPRDENTNNVVQLCGLVVAIIGVLIAAIGVFVGWRHWRGKQQVVMTLQLRNRFINH